MYKSLGPVTSVLPTCAADADAESRSGRADGRADDELRKICEDCVLIFFILFLLFLRFLIFYHLFTLMYTVAVAKPGVVSNAAGSAYIEVGSTKVVAACYGKRRLWLLSLEIVFIYPTRLCLKRVCCKVYSHDGAQRRCAELLVLLRI